MGSSYSDYIAFLRACAGDAEAIGSRFLQRGGVGGLPVRKGRQRSETGSGGARQKIFGRKADFVILDDPYARFAE